VVLRDRRFLDALRQRQTVDAATYVALTSVGTRPYVCVEMNYFAYGSNLNTDHLRSWLTRWGVDPEELGPPRKAILPGYRLRTNYLRSNGIGACNIEPRPRSRVEGIVMTVTPSIREVLRLKEGHPHRYAEIEIVVTPFGKQRTVRAFTYIVTHRYCPAVRCASHPGISTADSGGSGITSTQPTLPEASAAHTPNVVPRAQLFG
jgi:hypothetical protein